MNRDLLIGLTIALLLHVGVLSWANSLRRPAPEERVKRMLTRVVHEETQLPKPPPPPPPLPKPEPKPEPKPKVAPKPKDKPVVRKKRRGQPKRKKKKARPQKTPPPVHEPPPLVLSKTYDGGQAGEGVTVYSGDEDFLGDPSVAPTERNTRERVDERVAPLGPKDVQEEPVKEKKVVIAHAIPRGRCKVEWPKGAPRMRRIVEVMLQLTIDRRGKVKKTRVLRSAGEPFDSAARSALSRCPFKPGRRDGRPFVDRVPFVVEFKPGADA